MIYDHPANHKSDATFSSGACYNHEIYLELC